MNLQKASEKAKYLFKSTGIPQVVTETNGIYSVHTEKEWNGKIVKKYSHAKEINDIPELRATTDQDILQDSGDERPKPANKRRPSKG
jgi:hypothetical protein